MLLFSYLHLCLPSAALRAVSPTANATAAATPTPPATTASCLLRTIASWAHPVASMLVLLFYVRAEQKDLWFSGHPRNFFEHNGRQYCTVTLRTWAFLCFLPLHRCGGNVRYELHSWPLVPPKPTARTLCWQALSLRRSRPCYCNEFCKCRECLRPCCHCKPRGFVRTAVRVRTAITESEATVLPSMNGIDCYLSPRLLVHIASKYAS
eukprot:SAG31_NODE_102_length_25175_cov_10.778553_15_plen_208_part_00